MIDANIFVPWLKMIVIQFWFRTWDLDKIVIIARKKKR
jgi:hypothetical protein